MLYENELKLLCDTFKKLRIRTDVISPDELLESVLDENYLLLFPEISENKLRVKEYFPEAKHNTVYKFTDSLKLRYNFLLLPSLNEERLLIIGPYRNEYFSDRQILELGERIRISPKKQKLLGDYCTSIPVIEEVSHIFFLFDTFCEHLWGTSSFNIVDIDKQFHFPASPLIESEEKEFDDVLLKMKKMEKRYAYENELIKSVELGQVHKINHFFTNIGEEFFEMRTTDVLRNYKNYCIIMNTLLRKASENGGVHPMYLDSVSSSFAVKIEQLNTEKQVPVLMKEMFTSYCRLTHKHSMKKFSQLVQKTIIVIDADLSSNLTLSSLASLQNVSSGYLATVFKKETGKTVSEYIREKRMNHAAYLLKTTNLQIQTVALHCGIMDVQYFSKLFKQHTGKSPKNYRESIKQTE